MARTKKEIKIKEPVTIRIKEGKGKQSIYLDCYVNGKRWYEFLSKDIGYLYPVTDYATRAANAAVMQKANAIKMQRIAEIYNGKNNVQRISKNGKMLLIDWMHEYLQRQIDNGKKGTRQIEYTIKILEAYAGTNTKMQDIDKNFCIGYLNFIKHIQPNRKHDTMQNVSKKCTHNFGATCPQTQGELEQFILKQIADTTKQIESINKEREMLLNRNETERQWENTKAKLISLDAEILEKTNELNRLKKEQIKARERADQPTEKEIAPATARNYYRCFNCALNAAVREEIILSNPFDKIDKTEKIKVPESMRQYLTIEELEKLSQTACRRNDVKNAFLFSCFCGLRISDVKSITWGQLTDDNGQLRLQLKMKKTKDPIYLPLNEKAVQYMPQREDATAESVIFNLPDGITCNNVIKQWAKDAGITKKVTFHVARHTFATALLTKGADLFTVSKLLGHADIETTQIYAKIVNSKKDDAVNLLNNIF